MRFAPLLALVGCTVGPPSGPSAGIEVCGARSSYDGAVFAALTAVEWDSGCDGGGGGLAPTCTQIQLGADGHFSWTAISDYVERDQSGGWNFQTRSDHDGIVCLQTGAVLAFSIESNLLTFGPLGLSPGMALTATGSRGSLPTLVSDPLFPQLAHTWTKANRFDLYRVAQDITLVRDGTYTASYRDGACTHAGTWSVDLEPRTTGPTPVWWTRADSNACDLRNGGTTAELEDNGDTPLVEDSGLVLYDQAYREVGTTDTHSWFSFDAYSTSVRTTGTLDAELSASSPTTFDLVFDNRSDTNKTLTSFSVRATPVTLTTAGYEAAGSTFDLVVADLGNESLATLSQTGHSVTVSPPAAGDIDLAFELDYADAIQTYTSRASYIVTIGP
jgi:hypothetical protein